MAELLTKDAPAWSQFVNDFDGAYRSFVDNRTALINLRPYIEQKHPELKPQYTAMLARADELAPQLARLKEVRDTVKGWLGTAGDVYQRAVDLTSQAIEAAANKVNAAKRWLGLGELGAVPLIAVGVVAAGAAVVAVSKWVADAYLFAQRLNMLQALEAQGHTLEESAAAVNQVMGKPGAPGAIERTLSNVLWVAALVGIGLYVFSRVSERRR